ncbi:unnamed protein product [Blepharisma stoltei]|uniref:Ubiquitin n=1 Tax=Blepharisma stoltei TaxID=1481888 RepID=A0AAU9JES8_9CILI|nr:unnamed protein product [Blepharisma stoltei]
MSIEEIVYLDEYLCPITHELMTNPVVAADGITYEKSAITLWLKKGHHRSPVTNERLLHNSLIPNLALKKLIDKFRSELPLIQRENQVKVNIEEAVKFKEEVLKQAIGMNNQQIRRIEDELNEEKAKVERLTNEIEELKQTISENPNRSKKSQNQKTIESSKKDQYPNKRSKKSLDKANSQSKPRKKAKRSVSQSINFRTLAGQLFTIQAEENDNIAQVKNKIFEQEGFLQAQQVLVFDGKQLADEEIVSDINLKDDSIIYFALNPYNGSIKNQGSENFVIYVKTLSGATFEITANPNDTVEILKAKIQEIEGISPCLQRLMFQGKQLVDGPILADFGLSNESTIFLILRLAGC